ncbi:MAG: pyridoxal phosphate-dependent aminotransferase [Promethearchaeota archaeon]
MENTAVRTISNRFFKNKLTGGVDQNVLICLEYYIFPMKPASKKLLNVPKSNIRKLFDLLSQRKDTISLGIGQPDFKAPAEVINKSIEALRAGMGSVYAPTAGVPRFRELIAKKLKKENRIDADPEKNITVTPGGSGAIMLAFAAIFNPGDELLMFSPNFVSYFHVSRYFDAKVVEVPRRDDFGPDIDALKKRITSKSKALVINSPNNPTGYAFTPSEIEEVAAICNDHDLYLISDEVYEKYLYDSNVHVSPASINGMADRVLTLNALTKTFSTTGFRVGYICANEELTPLMQNFLQYTCAGVNHPLQFGGIAAMELLLENGDFLKDTIQKYERKRDICYKRLNEMGLSCPKPGGAFYIMPSVQSTGMDADSFSEKLVKEQGVAAVSGNTFGTFSQYNVRISYALDDDKLIEAMERMNKFLNEM